jgi:hypothetical protein
MFLARQPAFVLVALCFLSLFLVGWLAVRSPTAAVFGAAIWGMFVLRRRIGAGMRDVFQLLRQWLASVPGPVPVPTDSVVVIRSEMTLDGRLSRATSVEVFGRLSGEIQCQTIYVHPGGELLGNIVHRQLGVAAGGVFEGTAWPTSRSVVPVRQRRGPISA